MIQRLIYIAGIVDTMIPWSVTIYGIKEWGSGDRVWNQLLNVWRLGRFSTHYLVNSFNWLHDLLTFHRVFEHTCRRPPDQNPKWYPPKVTRLMSRGMLVNWWLRGLMGRWVHVVTELNMMFWNSWIEHVMRQKYSSYDEVSKYCSFDGSLNIDCWTNIPWFEKIFIIWESVAHVMNCWIFDRLSMCCSSDGLLAVYQKY